jgi:hypothetical protein
MTDGIINTWNKCRGSPLKENTDIDFGGEWLILWLSGTFKGIIAFALIIEWEWENYEEDDPQKCKIQKNM